MYWSICRQSYIVNTLFFHNFVTIRLDYLTIISHMTTLKESFRGQRMATIPESLLAKYKDDSLIGLLFLRKIGYFPHAKYHHVKKNDGCSYALLIHCTDGEGWVEIFHKRITIHKHQYIIIPADTPYSFGTDNSNPWTIYWIHFCGKLINTFAPSLVEPRAKDVSPAESSRLQERTHIFEEIFSSFSMGYIREYMAYSSMCLYHYLASFIFLEQYRDFPSQAHTPPTLIDRMMHYMNENVSQNLSLQDLSQYFHYSPSHISAIFSKQTGMSPINCFLRIKIQKACYYLELSNLKIHEIASTLGFSDPAYFSRLFHKIMKVSPQNYRNNEKAVPVKD